MPRQYISRLLSVRKVPFSPFVGVPTNVRFFEYRRIWIIIGVSYGGSIQKFFNSRMPQIALPVQDSPEIKFSEKPTKPSQLTPSHIPHDFPGRQFRRFGVGPKGTPAVQPEKLRPHPVLAQSPPDSPAPGKSGMPHGYPHPDPGVPRGVHSRGLPMKLNFQGMFGLRSSSKRVRAVGVFFSYLALCRRKAKNQKLFSIILGG